MSRLLTCAAIFLVAFSVLAAAGSAASDASSGWGSEASYLGRYRVHILPASSASAGSAGRQAAIFSAVVSACQKLSAPATRPTGGELTLFMREVKKGMPLVPSAILNLTAPAGNELLYLTYLTSSQGVLHAKINGGAFVGPVIGSFTGRRTGPRSISATATVEGLAPIEAGYARFSSTPQP
jgi:hypothetical protein